MFKFLFYSDLTTKTITLISEVELFHLCSGVIGPQNTSGSGEVKLGKVKTALLHDTRLLSVISILLLKLLIEGLETS